MALKANFTQADVKARFDKFLKVVEKRQIQRLQYLGEECVIRARTNADFTDQTGNLRSSIGYVVFKDGTALHDGYEVTPAKVIKDGTIYNGAEMGKKLAEKVGRNYTNGICLVVTAGMNYALYVEAKGRDVLTSTENFAKQELPKMLNELKQNISKALK